MLKLKHVCFCVQPLCCVLHNDLFYHNSHVQGVFKLERQDYVAFSVSLNPMTGKYIAVDVTFLWRLGQPESQARPSSLPCTPAHLTSGLEACLPEDFIGSAPQGFSFDQGWPLTTC